MTTPAPPPNILTPASRSGGTNYHELLSSNDPDMSTLNAPTPLHSTGAPTVSTSATGTSNGTGGVTIQDTTGTTLNTGDDPSQKQQEGIDDPKVLAEKEKKLRLKLYGYWYNLPELVQTGGLVDWPNPINAMGQYSLTQLEQIYEQVQIALAVTSQGGGAMLHNALTQIIETVGISQGWHLNGYAEELHVETVAKNLADRLRQLVLIVQIEYGLGIRNPLLEYGTILVGKAGERHRRLKNEDSNLFFEKQQYEIVPPGIDSDFSHL